VLPIDLFLKTNYLFIDTKAAMDIFDLFLKIKNQILYHTNLPVL